MKYGTVKATGIACGVGRVAAYCEAGNREIGGVSRVNRGAHPIIECARMFGCLLSLILRR